jgi:hypothetical protein
MRVCGALHQWQRFQNAAVNGVEDSRAGPSHALQKSPAVDAVFVDIVFNKVSHVIVPPSANAAYEKLAARGLRDVRLVRTALIPCKSAISWPGIK